MSKIRIYSGGAQGIDFLAESFYEKYMLDEVEFNIVSFKGHEIRTKGVGRVRKFKQCYLDKQYELIEKVSKTLKKGVPKGNNYKLIARNAFQVMFSNAIIALPRGATNKVALGGTGWTVEFAKYFGLEDIYAFNKTFSNWTKWSYEDNLFQLSGKPAIRGNTTIVGTRNPNALQISELKDVFKLGLQ